jgi:hypothetical protein
MHGMFICERQGCDLRAKDIILKNMQWKQRLFETCHTWARNKENGMLIRSVTMQRMRLFILKKIVSQLLNKFEEGLRGSGVESNNNLLKIYTYYSKVSPWLNLRLWSLSFLSWMSPYCQNITSVATLALGLWPRQGLARVRAKREVHESNLMLPGM